MVVTVVTAVIREMLDLVVRWAPAAPAERMALVAQRRLLVVMAVMAVMASTECGLTRCLLATAATVVLAARWVPVVTAARAVAAQLAAPVLMVRSSAVLAVMVLLVAMVETVAPGVLVDRSQVTVEWVATGVRAAMEVLAVRVPMVLP